MIFEKSFISKEKKQKIKNKNVIELDKKRDEKAGAEPGSHELARDLYNERSGAECTEWTNKEK